MLIECIPNFSEGRRPDIIKRIISAIEAVSDVHILDASSDADHNRSVVTFVAPPETVGEAAFAGIAKAAELIDMRQQTGQHPRMGATDVCPFVPIQDTTMDDCVAIAKSVGARVGAELAIPVYLYEAAATRPVRKNLANIRRGGYEAIRDTIATDPNRTPDFGPTKLGSAGAIAIGARDILIAFNVFLTTADIDIARKIATAIRHSSGGLRYVKAIGLLVEGQAQVSMNLTNFRQTPIFRVMEMIRVEAARYGVSVASSELIGLMPQQAMLDVAAWYLQLDNFDASCVLEEKIRNTLHLRDETD